MNFWRVTYGLVALACLVGAVLLLPVQAQPQAPTATDKKPAPTATEKPPAPTATEKPAPTATEKPPAPTATEKPAPTATDKKTEVKGDEVKFAFTAFEPGKPAFFQKLVTNTTQDMKVEKQGQPEMKQVQNQTFVIKWTPKDKDKKGNFVLEQQIVYVKMDISIGTTNISYESTTKEQPQNPMTEFFKSLMDVTLTLHIDPAMKVVEIEGGSKFIEKLGESHPQMKNLLKSILGDDALKKMSEQTWGAIPTKGVKVGETWDRDIDLSLGAIGKYKNKYTYKLDSYENGKTAKISVTPTMVYEAPKDKVGKEEQLPFEISKESKLDSVKGDTTGGTVIFDLSKGRVESSTMKMEVKGNVIIGIGGSETNVSLRQTQTSTLTTMDLWDPAKK